MPKIMTLEEFEARRVEAFAKLDEPFLEDGEIRYYIEGQVAAFDDVEELVKRDNLNEMLHKQDDLQKKVGTEYTVEFAKDMILAATCELMEFMQELPWKEWSKKHLKLRAEGIKFLDEEKARVEYIDIFHFMLNLGNYLGMSSDDILREYNAKWKINFDRQNSGY